MKAVDREVLKTCRRQLRDAERGEATVYSADSLRAMIALAAATMAHRELLIIRRAAGFHRDGDRGEPAALQAACQQLATALPDLHRNVASLLNQDGVDNWASFLPGFDDLGPGPEEDS